MFGRTRIVGLELSSPRVWIGATEVRRTRRYPVGFSSETRTRCLGHRPAWPPYFSYGSMQSLDVTGDKAPDRQYRLGYGPQPTAEPNEFRTTSGNGIGKNRKLSETRESVQNGRNSGILIYRKESETTLQRLRSTRPFALIYRRTATARAPENQSTARTVSPRSHKCETMTNQTRDHSKRIAFCNQSCASGVNR